VSGAYSPWLSEYFRPGTLLRSVAFRPSSSEWVPQFAGVVERWRAEYGGTRRNGFAEQRVTVEWMETVGLLGLIDENALLTPVGTSDLSGTRVRRLLREAFWKYSFFDEAESTIRLQSTQMAVNRLSELHITADSSDTYFRSHRSGVAMLEAADPEDHPDYSPLNASRWGTALWDTATWTGLTVGRWQERAASIYYRWFELRPDEGGLVSPDADGRPVCRLVYDPELLAPEANPDIIINDARFANVGGTQQMAEDRESKGRYGHRTLARTDLITQSADDVLTLAELTVARRAHRVMQVPAVDITSTNTDNLPGIFIIDLGDPVVLAFPDYLAVEGRVSGVTHSITSMTASRVDWRCSLALETYDGFVDPS
jgi:hypothetical protein